MKSYIIYLIRHGKCTKDDDVVYYGRTDVSLTEEGKELLRERRAEEEYPDVDAIYTSPMKRCTETLDILYPDREYITVENLKECDLGDFDGKSSSELMDNEDFHEWLRGKTPPNGETTQDFVKRSVVAFAQIVEDIMKKGEQRAVVCTHGGNIMGILSVCGIPEAPFSNWTCDNGGGYTLRITPSIWMRGYKAEIIEKIL